MLNIKLKERQVQKLSELKPTDTFKIPESDFVFMKIDVERLTVTVQPLASPGMDDPAPAKVPVRIPEGKAVVLNLNNGRAQFLLLTEEVQLVELEADEIHIEKETPNIQVTVH